MIYKPILISLLSVPKGSPYLFLACVPDPGLIFAHLFYRNGSSSFSCVNLQSPPISHLSTHSHYRSHLRPTLPPLPIVVIFVGKPKIFAWLFFRNRSSSISCINLQSSPISHPHDHSHSRSHLFPPLLPQPIVDILVPKPTIFADISSSSAFPVPVSSLPTSSSLSKSCQSRS